MSVTIDLTADQEELLRERAARNGQTPAAYAQTVIEQHLRPARSLSEILAPFRRQVQDSGVSDEELDALIEEARDEVFREKQVPAS